MLAPASPTADIVAGEAGGGQVPRQPGQVRKEAAVTSPDLGRSSGLPLSRHGFENERFGGGISRPRPQISAFDLRRADRAGGDGAHPVERNRDGADRPRLYSDRRARRR